MNRHAVRVIARSVALRTGPLVILAAAALSAQTFTQVAPGQPPVPRDPSASATQRVAVGPGSIAGIVIAEDTGRPIRRARLTLQGAPGPTGTTVSGVQNTDAPVGLTRVTVSDDDGRFAFNALPAGHFTVAIEAPHFLPANYGQRKFGLPGASLELSTGQQLELKVTMLHGGVITGTVFDERGEPLPDATVRPVRYLMQAGYRHLRTAGQATTNDHGVYRLADLEPGTYYVAATPAGWDDAPIARARTEAALFDRELAAQRAGTTPNATMPVPMQAPQPPDPVAFAPTYYPSGLMPAVSSPITVEVGSEHPGIDIRSLATRTGAIQGMVSGPPDTLASLQVLLQNMDPDAEIVQMTARANPDGSFVVPRVAPGQYTIYAQTVEPPPAPVNGAFVPAPARQTPADATRRLNGHASVMVTSHETAFVSIALQPGRSISGSLVFDMPQPPDPSKIRTMMSLAVAPQPIGVPPFSTNPQIQANADGTFMFAGVRPGQYLIRASGSGVIKSAVVNGQDILDAPLDFPGDRDITNVVVTMTDRLGELSGTLSNTAGKPIVDYTIVIAPADSRLWIPGSRRVMISRPAPDGRYTFRDLPAGEYMLAAVTEIEPAGQSNPEFLKQLAASAVRVTIGDRARQRQDLRTQ